MGFLSELGKSLGQSLGTSLKNNYDSYNSKSSELAEQDIKDVSLQDLYGKAQKAIQNKDYGAAKAYGEKFQQKKEDIKKKLNQN